MIDQQAREILKHALSVLNDRAPWYLSTPRTEMSERCLEVPWVASFFRGGEQCLDIGFTFASHDYLGLMLELRRGHQVAIDGVDIIKPERVKTRYPTEWWEEIQTVPVIIGDIRTVALPAKRYDVITCISTIEHVGFDVPAAVGDRSSFVRSLNQNEVVTQRDPRIDRIVLDRFAEALKPGGIVLMSVPMGKGGAVLCQDSLGYYCAQWEYEERSWATFLNHPAFSVREVRYFKHSATDRWLEVKQPADLTDGTANLAPRAHGCALLCLTTKIPGNPL